MDEEICGGKVKKNGKLVSCTSRNISITWCEVPLCQDCIDEMCKLENEDDFTLKKGHEFKR